MVSSDARHLRPRTACQARQGRSTDPEGGRGKPLSPER